MRGEMSAPSMLDALVVGAGPVGLTMAAVLMRHGLRCRIVEKSAARTDKSKALVLWPRTLELLDRAAAVEPFLAAGLRVRGARIFANRERLAELTLDSIASPYAFALMLPQSETERLLDAHLGTLGGSVERTVALRDFSARADGVTARLQHPDGATESVDAAWLIGCDGAHSAVRHGLGIDFAGEALPFDWLLADVRIDGPLELDRLRLDWHARGILAFFPIGPDRFRVIADGGPAAGNTPRDPSLADVQAVVDERGPGGLRVHDPVWLAGFRINERKVADYRHGRVFLAGDAAHIHSPAGGQGMNTGMQDAFNLAWKLALTQRGHAVGDVLLDSYSRERSAVGDEVLRNAGAMTRLATLRQPTAQHLRNALVPWIASIGFVQKRMRETLSELGIQYRASPLSCDDRRVTARRGAHIAAGDRAPDAALTIAPSGAATRLFAVCRGTRHCLLLYAGDAGGAADSGRALDEIGAMVRRAYPDLIDVFTVAPTAGIGGETKVLVDGDGALRDAYAVRAPAAVLIRPDGYIGYYGQPADADRLRAHLATYLRPRV
jgi:2-polyprenyl-6-methoxyphenol hydroxylase-like FAD-dependent oxidoreductase